MTNIHLCSIPFLTTSYTNVIDFENVDSRELWFTSKTLKTVKTNFKYDNQRAFIVINENFDKIMNTPACREFIDKYELTNKEIMDKLLIAEV